jgi:hypothetical protein
MAIYDATFTPVVPPNLTSATADALAQYQGAFINTLWNSASSLLTSYLDQKDTDFFAVGDLPEIWQQWYVSDGELWNRYYERPDTNRPTIDLSGLDTALSELDNILPPSAPSLASVDASTPNLDAQAPTITLPSQPDTTLPTPPTGEPDIIDPNMPTAPAFTLPAVPTFDDLNLPSAPSLSIPAYDEEAPAFNLAPYTGDFDYVDPGYASPLRDELVVKLLADLRNGTYGIEPNDEAGLWSRARDRAAVVARSEIEEVTRRAAMTSFPMPPGALYEAIEKAEQKHTQALSEANREIALRRSELYVEGRKFTFQQVQQYETMAQNLYNAVQERALNYAKALVEMGLAIYANSVQHFNAQLNAYQVKAQVFESRIRAELAKASIYKTQIEAESVRVDFNRAKIEQYLAQIKAIDVVVDLYKSQMAAVALEMQVQGQKIDIFKSRLQAYSEQLRAKEAEYNIYLAATRGELAKVDVYKAQIDAYNATLSGSETQARVKLQSNEALMQEYRAAVLAYQSQLEAAKKLIDARIDKAKTQTDTYRADVDAYRALTVSTDSAQQKLLDWGNLQQRYIIARNKSEADNVRFRLQQLGMSVDLQSSVNRYGSEFMRSAIGAATSGLNALGVKTGEE